MRSTTTTTTEFRHSVAYDEAMPKKSTPPLEQHRDDLRALASEQQSFPDRRREAVERARAASMTWREIAALLGMSEYGVRKAMAPTPPDAEN